MARRTAKDPIGFDGGPNQYLCVENDPVNFFDPSGLDRWHTDYGKLGEKLFHFRKYRFDEFGRLVEHSGKVIGEASGKAKKALDFLKSKKPGFFKDLKCGPPIILVPCFFDPALCAEQPGII